MHGDKKKCKFDNYRYYFYKLVDKRISELQWKSSNMDNIDSKFIQKSKKQAKSQNSKHPENRSEYIGVSRNGRGWQSLVIIKKVKLYISTSESEVQAARVWDFYTLLHHFDNGKYNHSYSIREAIQVRILWINKFSLLFLKSNISVSHNRFSYARILGF